MTTQPVIDQELERIAARVAFQLKDRIWSPNVTELARVMDQPNTTRVFEASTRQWIDVDLADAPEAIQNGQYNSRLYQLIKAALVPRRFDV